MKYLNITIIHDWHFWKLKAITSAALFYVKQDILPVDVVNSYMCKHESIIRTRIIYKKILFSVHNVACGRRIEHKIVRIVNG